MTLYSLRDQANLLSSEDRIAELRRIRTQDRTLTITRRGFLKLGGMAAAAATISLPYGFAAEAVSPAISKLSDYMSRAADLALPAKAMEATKQHILDTLAAMVSGAELPPGRVALRFAGAHAGERIATIVGSTALCGPLEASLVNGMLAHSDETDDSHAPSHTHPGCAVVPAALAAGEQFSITGLRFLRAVALGYDIGTRVMMTLGGLPFQMETHRSAHSIGGVFAAAAAAGCAAGLNAQQMRWLLDYAAQQASGVAAWQRDIEHVEKSLVFGGMPARNGVSAALLIQLGATGVDDVLSGPDNFLLAFSPKADPSNLTEKLGERYEVMRTTIKKWTVGSPIQAPLDALQLLMKKRSFGSDQVQKVVVRIATSEAKTVNNRDIPAICLQHMVAVMLTDKTVSFAAAHDTQRMQDPKVLRLRAKVLLIPDEQLEALYPKRQAIVEITLADGTVLADRVQAVRGTPDNPMTQDEVINKSRDLMTPFLGSATCAELIKSIVELENVKSILRLRPLLQTSRLRRPAAAN